MILGGADPCEGADMAQNVGACGQISGSRIPFGDVLVVAVRIDRLIGLDEAGLAGNRIADPNVASDDLRRGIGKGGLDCRQPSRIGMTIGINEGQHVTFGL